MLNLAGAVFLLSVNWIQIPAFPFWDLAGKNLSSTVISLFLLLSG
jgi:hypothetical protein